MMLALTPNLTKDNAFDVTENICRVLDGLFCSYCMEETYQAQFCHTKAFFLPENALFAQCDAAIAIGGDGTVIHTAKLAAPHHKAVLGINAGHLGFMAGLEKHELKLLSHLMDSTYVTDQRMMLEADVLREGKRLHSMLCINDAVIAHGPQLKLASILVSCDGHPINHYLADGVIVSTPTGSTAYSLAAGGPVIDSMLESITLTPICTHSLFARSLVFRPDVTLSVRGGEKDTGEPVYLSCDGEKSIQIDPADTVSIHRASLAADFIRIKSDTFIDILNSKLAERRA